MKNQQAFVLIGLSLLLPIINCSFQTDIFTEINKDYIGKNLIISPLSIYQVLSLTTNGAKSKTQEEMIKTLRSETIDDLNEINYDIIDNFKDFSTVEMANAVMSKYTPIDDFVEISENYLAPIETLKSVNQVNNWCSEKTHGKITKIIEELDPSTIMILLNAIYFKGEWSSKFVSRDTTKKPFYNFNKEENEIEVDTMTQTKKFNYYQDSEVQAIQLNYRKDSMSALIILPAKEIDINDYVESLSSEKELNNLMKKLKSCKVEIDLPKFEVNFSASLKKILPKMGMELAFSNKADFSGLVEEEKVKIDDVIHKTYLKVTEDGTEAAAVTAVVMPTMGSIDFPDIEIIYRMQVNRPFLFLLVNNKFPEDYDMLFMSKIEELK